MISPVESRLLDMGQESSQLLLGQVKYLQNLERLHQFQVITGFVNVVGELNSLNYLQSSAVTITTPRADSTSCDDRSSPIETGSHLFIWLMKWSIYKPLDYYCLIDGHPHCHTKKSSSPSRDLIGRTNLISNSIPRDLGTCLLWDVLSESDWKDMQRMGENEDHEVEQWRKENLQITDITQV